MPLMHPTVINAHAKLLTNAAYPSSLAGSLREGSQSLAESGQIPIHKEFNKSFKLQYYIPVCCLLLYMHCAHNGLVLVLSTV